MTAWQWVASVILGEMALLFLLALLVLEDPRSKLRDIYGAWFWVHVLLLAGACIWGLIAVAIGGWVPW